MGALKDPFQLGFIAHTWSNAYTLRSILARPWLDDPDAPQDLKFAALVHARKVLEIIPFVRAISRESRLCRKAFWNPDNLLTASMTFAVPFLSSDRENMSTSPDSNAASPASARSHTWVSNDLDWFASKIFDTLAFFEELGSEGNRSAQVCQLLLHGLCTHRKELRQRYLASRMGRARMARMRKAFFKHPLHNHQQAQQHQVNPSHLSQQHPQQSQPPHSQQPQRQRPGTLSQKRRPASMSNPSTPDSAHFNAGSAATAASNQPRQSTQEQTEPMTYFTPPTTSPPTSAGIQQEADLYAGSVADPMGAIFDSLEGMDMDPQLFPQWSGVPNEGLANTTASQTETALPTTSNHGDVSSQPTLNPRLDAHLTLPPQPFPAGSGTSGSSGGSGSAGSTINSGSGTLPLLDDTGNAWAWPHPAADCQRVSDADAQADDLQVETAPSSGPGSGMGAESAAGPEPGTSGSTGSVGNVPSFASLYPPNAPSSQQAMWDLLVSPAFSYTSSAEPTDGGRREIQTSENPSQAQASPSSRASSLTQPSAKPGLSSEGERNSDSSAWGSGSTSSSALTPGTGMGSFSSQEREGAPGKSNDRAHAHIGLNFPSYLQGRESVDDRSSASTSRQAGSQGQLPFPSQAQILALAQAQTQSQAYQLLSRGRNSDDSGTTMGLDVGPELNLPPELWVQAALGISPEAIVPGLSPSGAGPWFYQQNQGQGQDQGQTQNQGQRSSPALKQRNPSQSPSSRSSSLPSLNGLTPLMSAGLLPSGQTVGQHPGYLAESSPRYPPGENHEPGSSRGPDTEGSADLGTEHDDVYMPSAAWSSPSKPAWNDLLVSLTAQMNADV